MFRQMYNNSYAVIEMKKPKIECREELIVHQRDIVEYQELCNGNWNQLDGDQM
jgi:hypothetical protein